MNKIHVQQNGLAKKMMLPIVAMTTLLIMVAWLAGSFNTKVQPGFKALTPATDNSNHFTVKASEGPLYEGVAASITAKHTTIISSRLLARIDTINVRAGDNVKKGDILLTLESKDLTSVVLETSERVKAIQARHTEALKNFQRAKQLFERQIGSQFDVDRSKADYQSTMAELTAVKQSLAQAKTALSYATLRAPIDGKIVDRFAEPGDTAQAGSKLLSLYNPLSLRVEAQVREQLALTLSQGQNITVELPAIEHKLTGLIEEIVPAANTGSRTFLIKISLPYQESLLPGMYAHILIPAGKITKLLVPNDSVNHVGQLDFVTVIEDEQYQRRFVRTGKANKAGMIVILSGLSPGDIVLIRK